MNYSLSSLRFVRIFSGLVALALLIVSAGCGPSPGKIGGPCHGGWVQGDYCDEGWCDSTDMCRSGDPAPDGIFGCSLSNAKQCPSADLSCTNEADVDPKSFTCKPAAQSGMRCCVESSLHCGGTNEKPCLHEDDAGVD